MKARSLFLVVACFMLQIQSFAQTDNAVMHKVEKGQTLFGIARKYNASVADIRAANPGLKDGLQVDQVIKVPVKGGAEPSSSKEGPKETPKAVLKSEQKPEPKKEASKAVTPVTGDEFAGKQTHVVGAGQTLGIIARTYKTTVAEILKWNNMTKPNIRIGQRIIVAAPGQQSEAVTTATVKQEGSASKQDKKQTNLTEQTAKPAETTIMPIAGNAEVSAASGLEIQNEKGLAEGIDQDDNQKLQCLHRTAQVGTVIKVKNDLNGMVVYTKVVGKLPDIGPNEKLAIRLSKSAYQRLMPTEKRFPVTITFSQAGNTASSK